MDAYQVISHPGDEDEGARWACGARQQRGPVEIASGPAPAFLRLGRNWLSTSFGGGGGGGGILLFLPWLMRLVGLPNWRVAADGSLEQADDGRFVRNLSWNQPPVKFKAERRSRRRYIGSIEGVFWF